MTDNPFDEQLTPEEIRAGVDTGPKTHKIRIEMVYRVWREVEINEENYGNALEEAEEGTTLENAAFELELAHDEEEVYTQIFSEEIESNGPDDCYILIQLVDPDGKVVRQGTVEGNDHEASVRPQYEVSDIPIEDANA